MPNEQQDAQRELFMRTRQAAASRLASIRGVSDTSKTRIDEIPRRNRPDVQNRRDGLLATQDAKTDDEPKSLSARVADLEIRVYRLWDMLTEKSLTTGKDKLSKEGRRFSTRFNSR